MSFWLEGLNPEQQEAVLHNGGPLLILAGAGSGKTTVLVARSGRLIEEKIVEAKNLCVLTFTNKAAKELKSRVSKKLGGKSKNIWAGTFHSFGLQFLKKYYKQAGLIKEFGILNPGDSVSIAKELLKDFHSGGKVAYDGDRLVSLFGEWREKGITEARSDDEYEVAMEWLLPKLLKRHLSLGMVDFEDLILKPIQIMQHFPEIKQEMNQLYQHLMVDEFQDTNASQMRLIRLLSDDHRNIAVVGDDDQSIYGWRGACVTNILHFPRTYQGCKVVALERNYRSTPEILHVANAVIEKNLERHRKILKPANLEVQGEKPEILVCEDENDEVEKVTAEIDGFIKNGFNHREIAVLYRSNGQGALLEAELRKQGIAYVMTGGTAFFDRRETRDVLAYLRCALKINEVSLRRILNVPSRGVGEATVEKLSQFAESQKIGFISAVRKWEASGIEPKTGHAIDALFEMLSHLPLRILSRSEGTFGATLVKVFRELGYHAYIEKYSPNALVAANRWKLLEVFGRILDKFLEVDPSERGLSSFVDAMELRDAVNESKENEERVQLLTLHACKGLEWKAVIFIGVEEDLIPHKMLGSDIAEERRLFYVGVTRAQRKLILTRAKRRQRHGKVMDVAPSRFLLEVPSHLLVERTQSRAVDPNRRRAMLDALYAKLESPS